MNRFSLALALVAVFLVGCGDDKTTNPPPSAYRDLVIHLQDMVPHVGQLMEFRVVSTTDSLRTRFVVDPLPSAGADFAVRSAVLNGSHRLDFFADLNGNGNYNPPPADHAWRLNLPDTGVAEVTFAHNTDFTDIATPATIPLGNEFRLSLTGFTPHLGQLMEFKVVHVASGRTVGQYRLDSLEGADFDVVIEGIIENEAQYRVDFYADFNNNDSYNSPPTDHAWRITGTGDANGLHLSFQHNTNFTDINWE